MSQDAEDFIHHYEGYHGFPSQCRIRIFKPRPRTIVVIATELPDNPGTTVTNVCEELANQFYHFLGGPEGFLWIEHYPHVDSRFDESFDIVEFNVQDDTLHTPNWQRISKTQVE